MTPATDDRAWFEQAVLAVLPTLVGTARRLARNREDAEDLAAEAVTRAWLNLDTLKDRDRFAGWICRILTSRHARRAGRHGPVPARARPRAPAAGAAVASFAGVGYPFAAGVILPGDVVLDIGSGSGTDALIAARLVGPAGRGVVLRARKP